MIDTIRDQTAHVLHFRFEGRSAEMPLESVGLNLQSTDEQIKQALATHLDRSVCALHGYVVVRHRAAIVVRPEAIYG